MKREKHVWIKRIFCVALSCALCFSVGCADENGAENSDSSNVETTVSSVYNYTTGVDVTASPLPLVENGVAKYQIVLQKDLPADVISAVSEMNGYIQDRTGALLSTSVDNGKTPNGKFISIGDTSMAEAVGLETDSIRYDGYRIRSVDGNLYIKANLDRGLKYGIYGFIERFIGVRWLTNDYTYIPEQTQTLNAYPCDVIDEPVFQMREWLGGDITLNSAFRDKMRCYNGSDIWCKDVDSSHNTTQYVNPEHIDPSDSEGRTLGETHPEYFTTYTNKVAPTTELCFTNGITADGKLAEGQSVASLMIDKIKSFLVKDAEKREIEYMMIGKEDDRRAVCNCDTCEERRKEILDSGIWVMYMNVIEEEVNAWLREEQNREVKFIMFAYQYTQTPPVVTKNDGSYAPINDLVVANDNIYVRIAPIDADYTYSFADPRQSLFQKTIIYGWDAVADHFMIWDYQCNFVEYFWYYPTNHYLKENLQTYADMGVVNIMNQSSYTQDKIWFDQLRSYVSSKLYWNLDWDMEYLMNEFIELFYDAAAPMVKEVYRLFDDYYASLRMDGKLKVSILQETAPFLGGELHEIGWLNKIITTIDNAMLGVKAEDLKTGVSVGEVQERLELIKLTPMRMILRNYTSYYGEETKKSYAIEFFELCDKYGITYLGETGIRSVATRKAECGL